jgi:hypothetical protein
MTFPNSDDLGCQMAVSLFKLFTKPDSPYTIAGFTVVDAAKPIRIIEDSQARIVIMLKDLESASSCT